MDKLTKLLEQQARFERIANPFQKLIDANQQFTNLANIQNDLTANLTRFSNSLFAFERPSTPLFHSIATNNFAESLNSCIYSNAQLTIPVPLVRNDFIQAQQNLESLFSSMNAISKTLSQSKVFEDIVNTTTQLNSCLIELSKKYQYNIPRGFSDIVFEDDHVEVPSETFEDLSLEVADIPTTPPSSQETTKSSKFQIISWNEFIKILISIFLTFLFQLAGDYINSELISKADKETPQYIINYVQEFSNYFLIDAHNDLEDNQDDQSPVEPHFDECDDPTQTSDKES